MNNSNENGQCTKSVPEDESSIVEYKKQIEELKNQLDNRNRRITCLEKMNSNLATRLNESVTNPFYVYRHNNYREKSDYKISDYIHDIGMLSLSSGLVVASYHPNCPRPNATQLLGLSIPFIFKSYIPFSTLIKMTPLLCTSYLVYCGMCIYKSKS